MAEEGILGIARAQARTHSPIGNAEPSREELQRRMEDARESISHTVEDIKETVVHQYEAVKESLDWREQFKKRPVAWSLGAAGTGFLVGYGVAALVKGSSVGYAMDDKLGHSEQQVYAGGPVTGKAATNEPGLIHRFKGTQAYDHLRNEASNLGRGFVNELSRTANEVVLPVAIGGIRSWLERRLSTKRDSEYHREDLRSPTRNRSSFQPVPEPNL